MNRFIFFNLPEVFHPWHVVKAGSWDTGEVQPGSNGKNRCHAELYCSKTDKG